MRQRQRYPQTITFKRALISAGVLHAVILFALLVRVAFPSSDSSKKLVINPQNQSEPIQAVAISEKDLSKELQRLNQIEQKKRDEKLAQERAVKEAAEQARKAKEAEAQRVAALKEQQRKQAEAAQQKKLAEAKAKADAAKAAADKAAAAKAAAKTAAAVATPLMAPATQHAAPAGPSAEDIREIDRYKALVRQQIMRYWVVQGGLQTQDATKLFVRVAPTGTVLDVKVVQSSGNEALDRSAIAAVYKASPLPVPQDPELFRSFRELRLTLRPDSILSEG